MKKFTLYIFFVALSILIYGWLIPRGVHAQESKAINLYLFYGEGCPHCAKEKVFLDELKSEYQEKIDITEYEIYYNKKNADIFEQTIEEMNVDVGGVPFLIVGDEYFIGYGSDADTGSGIKKAIDKCLTETCTDIFNSTLNEKRNSDNKDPLYIDTYFWGKFDIKSVSIPLATVIIAFIDGFNPCAMWILIFLTTMLVNMKDKKKLFTLGSIFILTSGVVYFLFLSAWFNIFKFIGYVYWIKVVIGITAVITGIIHVRTAIFSKEECHLTNPKQRASIIERIKKTLNQKSYLLAILGIITLAASVNLIEVVCSAGLPAIYTNLLSSVELSTTQYYLYLLMYVFIFMLDDLLIFVIAIKTFEVAGITKKYSKYSNLIGGGVLFIIGLILIFKPELLMFG